MPTDPNIVDFLEKYWNYSVADTGKVTGAEHSFLIFPSQLESNESAFVKNASDKYRDSFKKPKLEQDSRKMIPDGNSYYFIRALAKAHRMYRRSRITNACIKLSESAGVTGKEFINNLKQLGTVDVNPMIGGAK